MYISLAGKSTPLAAVDDDQLVVHIYAALFRILEQVSTERKISVFRLIARYAAGEIAGRRQQVIDDLKSIAEQIGLGVEEVQNAIADAWAGA
jgi:hypothetical protein